MTARRSGSRPSGPKTWTACATCSARSRTSRACCASCRRAWISTGPRGGRRTADGLGLVATAGSPERIVAHAEYIREAGDRAEVADAWHDRGIDTILLAHLASAAGVLVVPTDEEQEMAQRAAAPVRAASTPDRGRR